ncbi:MAG: EAL domain-containing protein [Candidatus Sericytochromatia bacterium]
MSQELQAEINRLQLALELERQARLAAEARAGQYKQTHFLQAVALAANESDEVQDLLKLALKLICEYTGWQVGHVFLAEEASFLYSSRIWQLSGASSDAAGCLGREPELCGCTVCRLQAFCLASEALRLKPGEDLPGRVLASGEPENCPDLAAAGLIQRQNEALEAGLRSAYAMPIRTGREVKAVLEFFSSCPMQVDPELMGLLQKAGAQLGRAIQRKQHETRLVHEAFHDPLTGLPNRALFLDWIERRVARSQRYPERPFAVLFIDLDGFKLVNDSLGHFAGDQMLMQAASRIFTSLRREDVLTLGRSLLEPQTDQPDSALARFGGDEFIALIDDLRDPSDAVRVAERIQEALKQPYLLEGQEVYTSASIGIVWGSGDYASGDDLLRDADLAMYRAKALGKARYEVYDQTLHALALKRLRLEADLRRALKAEEFVLHYQPIYSLKTRAVMGFEALVRWQEPGVPKLTYPDEFIPVAEDSGLIEQLDIWVLREACRRVGQWHSAFPREQPLTISVNISARHFARPDLVAQVKEILAETGIPASALRLEITESASMSDVERTIRVLGEFRSFGVNISLDDFGTGYSSLSYLHRFPLDILKIDRSFVMNMDQNPESDHIVRTILSLAQNLGFAVVAEGTETEAHVQHLQALGCEYAQGYYFSRPLTLEQVEALLAEDASLKI